MSKTRKNFPSRQNKRRQGALDRLKANLVKYQFEFNREQSAIDMGDPGSRKAYYQDKLLQTKENITNVEARLAVSYSL